MTPGMTLGEARDWLRARVEDGAPCPCCTQFAKVYKRKIYSTLVLNLIECYRTQGRDWFHLRTVVPVGGGDFAKLAFWGLVEEAPEEREDGGRAGWWRLTDLGCAWLEGHATVLSHARIYDGRCLGLLGEPISAQQSLGAKFDLRDLMDNNEGMAA